MTIILGPLLGVHWAAVGRRPRSSLCGQKFKCFTVLEKVFICNLCPCLERSMSTEHPALRGPPPTHTHPTPLPGSVGYFFCVPFLYLFSGCWAGVNMSTSPHEDKQGVLSGWRNRPCIQSLIINKPLAPPHWHSWGEMAAWNRAGALFAAVFVPFV